MYEEQPLGRMKNLHSGPVFFSCIVTLQGNNCQQLISIESVDPLHLRLQQNKTLKEMKIKESQPCVNCKKLKRKGVARNGIRQLHWSAEVLDFTPT